MVGARYALAISRHPAATHIPQPHPHTRYLIDRTLGHFENRYREDISVVSRAGINEQLPADTKQHYRQSPCYQRPNFNSLA
jgi:hypothetical protein